MGSREIGSLPLWCGSWSLYSSVVAACHEAATRVSDRNFSLHGGVPLLAWYLYAWLSPLPRALADPPRALYHHPVGLVSQQWVQGEPTIAQLMQLLGFA